MGKNTTLFCITATFLLGVILCISPVSALLNTGTYEPDAKTGYGKITISTWYDLPLVSKDVAELELKENTLSCSNDCKARINISLLEEGALVDDVIFYRIMDDGKFVESNIRSYQVMVKTGEETKDVPVYEQVCTENGVELNGTKIMRCEMKETGKEKQITELWEQYTEGASYPVGDYVIELRGSKKPEWNYDWQIKTAGIWTEEWATWGSASTLTFTSADEFNDGVFNTTKWYTIERSGKVVETATGLKVQALDRGYLVSKENITDWNQDISFNITWNNTVRLEQAYIGFCNETIIPGDASCNGIFIIGGWGVNRQFCAGNICATLNATMSPDMNGTVLYRMVINKTSQKLYVNNILNQSLAKDMTAYGSLGKLYFGTGGGGSLGWSNNQTLHFIRNNINVTSSITINSPADNFVSINLTNQFNCTATMSGATFVNMSLMTNSTGTWKIDNTTTTNGANMSLVFPSDANYIWNCRACDSDGDCGMTNANRTIIINQYFSGINSASNNATSIETKQESFTINASNMNSASLIFNGTTYTGTVSGDTATASLIHNSSDVGNKSFYWKLNGGVTNSSTYFQNTIPLQFGICNSSNTVNYLNLTFKDETSDTGIAAAINSFAMTYYMSSDISYNKTFSYTNLTEGNISGYCLNPGYPTINIHAPTIKYLSTGYPLRQTILPETSLTNTSTQKTLYLLPTADGIYVTFQVLTSSNQNVDGATLTATTADGVVCGGVTDSAGSYTCWLDSNTAHTITVSKTGFANSVTSITPTQTSYSIILGESTTTSIETSRGISYQFSPATSVLINNTVYDFSFILNSSYNVVSSWGFNLTNEDGTNVGSTSSTNNGGTLTLTKNVGTNDSIRLVGYWITNGTLSTASNLYTIWNPADTQYSIKQIGDDLTTYMGGDGMFGLKNGFSLNMIILLIIIIITGVFSYKYGLYSPVAIATCIAVLVVFFDFGLGLITMPDGVLSHFASIFMIIVAAALWIKEVLGY